ncbi:MAG TPA: ankyrin repeat domain-containing protein [bacterium]|nr:ankyrin repeat domain-containing protein [bacterium]
MKIFFIVLTLMISMNIFGYVEPEGYTTPDEEKNSIPNQKLCLAQKEGDWQKMVYWLKNGGKCILCKAGCMFTDIGIIALKGDVEEIKKKEEEFKKKGKRLYDTVSDFGCGPWPNIPTSSDDEITNENCNGLLGMAALGGNVEMVKFLTREDNDVMALDGNTGGRILYSAALGGNLDVVKFLIKKGAKIKEPAAYEKRTLLHAAANGGNLDIFNLFLKSKTQNVNAVDGFGDTVLHWAVIGGNKEIVKTLLEEGADKNAKNNFNRTPLDIATERNNKEIEKILKEFQKPEKPKSSGCLPDLF